MNPRRSRLALIGVLALAVCVAVSLVAGSAEAKKGKKKKGGNSITVSRTTPTPIPAGDGLNEVAGVASVPLTVGKKAKGKVVSSLTATYQLTDPAGALDDLDIKVVSPSGRTIFLNNPATFFGDGDTVTVIGPLTQTADSSTGFCFPDPTPPPNGCPDGDPDNSLAPPWAGTARLVSLTDFDGGVARGTWQVKAVNFSTTSTHVLSMASIHMNLVPKQR